MSDISTLEAILIREKGKKNIEAQEKLGEKMRKEADLYNNMGLPHINSIGEKNRYIAPISDRIPLTRSRADVADEKFQMRYELNNALLIHMAMRIAIVMVLIRIPVWMGVL